MENATATSATTTAMMMTTKEKLFSIRYFMIINETFHDTISHNVFLFSSLVASRFLHVWFVLSVVFSTSGKI